MHQLDVAFPMEGPPCVKHLAGAGLGNEIGFQADAANDGTPRKGMEGSGRRIVDRCGEDAVVKEKQVRVCRDFENEIFSVGLQQCFGRLGVVFHDERPGCLLRFHEVFIEEGAQGALVAEAEGGADGIGQRGACNAGAVAGIRVSIEPVLGAGRNPCR